MQQPVKNGVAAQQGGKGTEAGLPQNAEDGVSESAQQQKAPGQGNAAEGKGQLNEQVMRGAPQEGKPSESAAPPRTAQGTNPQPTRREGAVQDTAQEKPMQQGRNPADAPANMQGETKSAAARQTPVMQNTPQLMQSLKDTAAFMLKNMPLTEKDAALLRDFVNNGQKRSSCSSSCASVRTMFLLPSIRLPCRRISAICRASGHSCSSAT